MTSRRWQPERHGTVSGRHTSSNPKGLKIMIREMLGIAEGILQDLHNDHGEVDTLLDKITDSK
jgi:hypothetical protein